MIATSEPWITLRRNRETCLKTLSDPSREVYVATTGGDVIGVLILHLVLLC